jgi:hypothetical protein
MNNQDIATSHAITVTSNPTELASLRHEVAGLKQEIIEVNEAANFLLEQQSTEFRMEIDRLTQEHSALLFRSLRTDWPSGFGDQGAQSLFGR